MTLQVKVLLADPAAQQLVEELKSQQAIARALAEAPQQTPPSEALWRRLHL
jgi:hypothetical protein